MRRVEDAHAGPTPSVAIGLGGALLGIDIAAEIRCRHPGVPAIANGVDDGIENPRLKLIEMRRFDQAHDFKER